MPVEEFRELKEEEEKEKEKKTCGVSNWQRFGDICWINSIRESLQNLHIESKIGSQAFHKNVMPTSIILSTVCKLKHVHTLLPMPTIESTTTTITTHKLWWIQCKNKQNDMIFYEIKSR